MMNLEQKSAVIRIGKPSAPMKTPRVDVLVVQHADGWVEIYGEGVNVHIANKLHATTPEGEIAAEEYLDLALPLRFRKLYCPKNLAGTGQCRRVLPSQEEARLYDVALVRGLGDAERVMESEVTDGR